MTKHKQKVKTIIKKIYEKPAEDLKKVSEEVKGEISELEKRKQNVGKGVKGFLRKAAINREIYEKKKYLTASERTKIMSRQTEMTKKAIELEEARQKLGELNKKQQVSFDSLGGINTGFKSININDLY